MAGKGQEFYLVFELPEEIQLEPVWGGVGGAGGVLRAWRESKFLARLHLGAFIFVLAFWVVAMLVLGKL